MRQTTKDLNLLKEDDLITIILFCLYKFTSDPNYSTLAELAYTLDKDNMYKLCATFGGTTLKIPTLSEYKFVVSVMLVFDYVNSKKMSFSEACSAVGVDPESDEVIKLYQIMENVINSYE